MINAVSITYFVHLNYSLGKDIYNFKVLISVMINGFEIFLFSTSHDKGIIELKVSIQVFLWIVIL